MRTKKRLHPYVTREVERRLESYCAAKGITVSAFVEGAIEERLKGDPRDLDMILRRLDRQDRAFAAHQRDHAVMMESVAAFVRIWFAFQPPIPEADRAGYERMGARRYDQFLDVVAKQLATGRGFLADLTKGQTGATGDVAPPTAGAVARNRNGQ